MKKLFSSLISISLVILFVGMTKADSEKQKSLKCVLLDDIHTVHNRNSHAVSTHLIKPVTQESIFELIVSLFEHHESNIVETKFSIEKLVDIHYEDAESLNDSDEDNFNGMIKEKQKDSVLVFTQVVFITNQRKLWSWYRTE